MSSCYLETPLVILKVNKSDKLGGRMRKRALVIYWDYRYYVFKGHGTRDINSFDLSQRLICH
jgi:hypothetical protein